ncbi:MAG: hypothetical protein JWL88_298 [Parcubacteria group bacterium]|nr:hypothetical protein [Parcubacteria group bacterium]
MNVTNAIGRIALKTGRYAVILILFALVLLAGLCFAVSAPASLIDHDWRQAGNAIGAIIFLSILFGLVWFWTEHQPAEV